MVERFEALWARIVADFRRVDEIGLAAVADAATRRFEDAIAKSHRAEAIAASVCGIWAANRMTSWSGLDEPLRAYASSYVDGIRRGRADLAIAKAGLEAINGAAGDEIQRKTRAAARVLVEGARALTASLGGKPNRIATLGDAE